METLQDEGTLQNNCHYKNIYIVLSLSMLFLEPEDSHVRVF